MGWVAAGGRVSVGAPFEGGVFPLVARGTRGARCATGVMELAYPGRRRRVRRRERPTVVPEMSDGVSGFDQESASSLHRTDVRLGQTSSSWYNGPSTRIT